VNRCPQIATRSLLLLITLVSAACGLMPAKPANLDGQIMAAALINPDLRGRASPIVLRVYELNADEAFANADFFSLFDHEQDVLGKQLNARTDYQLMPGQQIALPHSLQAGTQYIGVIGAFRDLVNAQWRSEFKIPPHGTTPLTIRVADNRVTIESARKP
jgi:type VI secretion system protein VasD